MGESVEGGVEKCRVVGVRKSVNLIIFRRESVGYDLNTP